MIYLFGLDEGFAMPTGVSARSLDRYLAPDDEVVFLHLALSAASISKLEACITNAQVRLIDCQHLMDPGWIPADWLTSATFLRYLAADLLEGAHRCVYLDGDVVVRRSPRELAEMDLQGLTIAAVRSRVAPFAASPGGIRRWFELDIPSTAPYFNAGVLVIDLERWRTCEVTPRLTAFLRSHGQDTWNADQEALNAVLVDEWVAIDRTWNYVTHVSESFLQEPEIEPNDPHIVHFAGRAKPWSNGALPLFAEDWYRVLDSTPWRGFTPPRPPTQSRPRSFVRRKVRRLLGYLRSLISEP